MSHSNPIDARALLRRFAWWPVMLLVWLGSVTAAFAHKPSDSYLRLSVSNTVITGQWDIALRDLEFVLGLDADEDGQITWGEVRARHPDIDAFSLGRLKLRSGDAPLALSVTDHLIANHSDGAYAVLRFETHASNAIERLEIEYRLFFDLDPLHRGLLNLQWAGATNGPAPATESSTTTTATNLANPALAQSAPTNSPFGGAHTGTNELEHNRVPPPSSEPGVLTAIFSPQQPVQVFTLGKESASGGFFHYLEEGVHHIWIGTDHILFLLSLLLPAVFFLGPNPSRHGARTEFYPHRKFQPAFFSVFKVVTAFTVAHSITLSLAALGAVELPSRLVESTIAASIVVAALNNLKPFFRERAWLVAFVFGLIHGFGFASVLADLGLPRATLVSALIAFNVGVELGQLAIVAVFLPLAFVFRSTWLYKRLMVRGGSLLVIAIATAWFIERAFDLKFMPF